MTTRIESLLAQAKEQATEGHRLTMEISEALDSDDHHRLMSASTQLQQAVNDLLRIDGMLRLEIEFRAGRRMRTKR